MHGNLVLLTRRHPALQAPEQPHTGANKPTTAAHGSRLGNVEAAASHSTLAVFAAHLATSLPHRCHIVATSCRILPFLPPITPNVKLPIPANPLQFRLREEVPPDTPSKNGKNGNV